MTSRYRTLALTWILVTAALAPAAFAGSVAADPSVSVDTDGGVVTVANGTSQVVRGTADAPVGTEIVVRVRSVGDTEPVFLKTSTGVVTENGTWATTFDFDRQRANDTFALTARFENGSAETEVDGEVVACGEECAETPPSGTPTPIPEQTRTATPTDGPSPPVAFAENIFLVDRGGVAAIPISFSSDNGGDADEAVVVIGDESDSNYELEAVVRDGDDDGQAVLYVDTSLAGRSDETLSTSGGDSVRVVSETSLDSTLDVADYDVSLYAGSERAGDPVDVGSLVVQTETTRTSTVTAAPVTSGETSGGVNGIGLGPLAVGGVVSGAFIVGGALLAALLLKG
ncbi:BGTF surface domain-containing protein [Halobellus rufus]|uniref:BGTF surface domain-containing protein n=1 Tax=Halobellus rufus TaxID=1448860 RepID=UPI0006790EB7|nr:BGTF surface domain-containing protein [Halobellus rufus]